MRHVVIILTLSTALGACAAPTKLRKPELTLTSPVLVTAQEVGVTAGVINDVTGTLGATGRVLVSGNAVSRDEVIETGDESATQVLFKDRTSVTMDENARLKLNRFVYDPAESVGDLGLEVVKGGFRFVSGIAKRGKGYSVDTPRLTIGIRGSIVEGYVDEASGREVILLVQGTMQVCSVNNTCVTTSRLGDFVEVSPAGVLTRPRAFPGPFLHLDADINFAKLIFGKTVRSGRDENFDTTLETELFEGDRDRPLEPNEEPEPNPEPEPEPENQSRSRSRTRAGAGAGAGTRART